MKFSNIQKAYIAGFLDGDGSIHIRLRPNSTYRYRFQIAPAIVFYQSSKEKSHLQWLRKIIKKGYIRERNDGIIEYIIGDMESMKELIKNIFPYLKLKRKQAKLMLEVLEEKQRIRNAIDFLKISKKIDLFQKINYSKTRIQNSSLVEKTLKKEGLLTP